MSWVEVCRADELPAVGAARADVDGTIMAIVRTQDGQVRAIDDMCTHANVSLSEGEVEGCEIECWLHASRFDLRTGDPSGLPATVPVAVYAVKVEDGTVFVDPACTQRGTPPDRAHDAPTPDRFTDLRH